MSPALPSPLDDVFLGDHVAALPRAAGLLHEALVAHARWRLERYPWGRATEAPALDATREALRELGDDLRRSVPYFSPRYVGHMAAEPLLPATLAKMVAALYNQNNVAEESAPATAAREREVIAALVRMLGLGADGHTPWGHLTSGGSVANYEGLWHLRAARFYGVALATAIATTDLPASVVAVARPLLDRSPWERINLPLDALLDLRAEVFAAAAAEGAGVARALAASVERHRLEHVGQVRFHAALAGIDAPVVLLPETAHYSWLKAANLLGIGAAQLVRVPTDARMRLRPDALAERVAALGRACTPIITTVAVVGCTQFGAVDPIDRLLAVREDVRREGLDFGLHLDAAWGGFLTTLLRDGDGRPRSLAGIQRDCGGFPERATFDALRAIAHADSVTIDPHKQGFVPFGAGAFLVRRGELAALNTSDAAYVFGRDAARGVPEAKMSRDLGRYSLEGSRSGEAAAACSVAYRIMPLDATGLGRLVAASLRSARRFVALVEDLDPDLTGARLRSFVRPETNIVCLTAVPLGTVSLRRANTLTRALAARLEHTPDAPGEGGFVASTTVVELATLEPMVRHRLLLDLGLADEPDDDHVFLLRHTLMNPRLDANRRPAEARLPIDANRRPAEARLPIDANRRPAEARLPIDANRRPGEARLPTDAGDDALDPLADYARHIADLCAALTSPSAPKTTHEAHSHAPR